MIPVAVTSIVGVALVFAPFVASSWRTYFIIMAAQVVGLLGFVLVLGSSSSPYAFVAVPYMLAAGGMGLASIVVLAIKFFLLANRTVRDEHTRVVNRQNLPTLSP